MSGYRIVALIFTTDSRILLSWASLLAGSCAAEARAGTHKTETAVKAVNAPAAAVIQPEIIRRMFIAGLARGCLTQS